MLISDWSSDVCSSDLIAQHSREAYGPRQHPPPPAPSERAMSERRKADEAAAAWDARLRGARASSRDRAAFQAWLKQDAEHEAAHDRLQADRKSVVEGKSVSVRVDLGGRRIIKKKDQTQMNKRTRR